MKLAVLGIGNMGQALVGGFLEKEIISSGAVWLYDVDKAKAKQVAEKFQCNFIENLACEISQQDFIILAVKPLQIAELSEQIRPYLSANTVIISIAAAVNIQRLKELFQDTAKVVRVMPNTPALVQRGVSAFCSEHLTQEDSTFITKLFSACGLVVECEENILDAISSVSGTGPAFTMLFIESLADAAVKLGIPRDLALQIASMTVYGSGKLAYETGKHPAILKDMVCSPGGTTIEGVLALEEYGLRNAVAKAVIASDTKTKIMQAQTTISTSTQTSCGTFDVTKGERD